MPRLITDWSTDDPKLAESLKRIKGLAEHTPERYEMEAALHVAMARVSWREADRLRDLQQARDARQKAHEAKQQAKQAGR